MKKPITMKKPISNWDYPAEYDNEDLDDNHYYFIN